MTKWMLIFCTVFTSISMTDALTANEFIQIKGSDTEVNLVQVWAEIYMEKNSKAAISVTGGGSGVGITALINGTADIANHSRPIKEKEYAAFEKKGIVATTVVIGIDALSIIVNEKNPIDSLSIEDLGRIYRSELDKWNQVGGSDKSISLYGRQPNSGTYVFFQEHVLGNKDYSPRMKQMNGNAQIVEAVKADVGGIGYVGVGYLHDEKGNIHKGIKVVSISMGDKPAYAPANIEDVKSGHYPITRPLFQTIKGKPTGIVNDFIAYELNEEGQKIVIEQGFFPVGGAYLELNKKAGF